MVAPLSGGGTPDLDPLGSAIRILKALGIVPASAHGIGPAVSSGLLLGFALLITLAAAIALIRWWAILRTLATRSGFAILPTTSFQPSTHRTEAFARQLVFAPHQVRNWVDRPALALRIHLTSTGEGRMGYWLEVAERSIPGLRGALSAYDEIQLEPLELAGRSDQDDDTQGELA